jgi:hypothetical protein
MAPVASARGRGARVAIRPGSPAPRRHAGAGDEAHVVQVALEEARCGMTEHDPGPHDLERGAEVL